MRRVSIFFVALPLVATLSACSSFSPTVGRAWALPSINPPKSIALAYPAVDRSSYAASIEGELFRLAPFIFMKYGLPIAANGAESEYIAEIHAAEREYSVGWKTRRSTILGVVVKRGPSAEGAPSEFVAAARFQAQGKTTLISSRTLYRLLDKAVRKLARKLHRAGDRR